MQRRIRFLTLLFAVGVLSELGCRDGTPTVASSAATGVAANADRGGNGPKAGAMDEHGDPRLLICAMHDSATVSVTVGATGANVTVGRDHLIIPAGALSEPTLITATIPADTLADIRFKPHGLQFAKSASLVLKTDGCDVGAGSPDHVVYLDDSGNVLETLDAVFNGGSHTVTAKIGHFSSYAIAF